MNDDLVTQMTGDQILLLLAVKHLVVGYNPKGLVTQTVENLVEKNGIDCNILSTEREDGLTGAGEFLESNADLIRDMSFSIPSLRPMCGKLAHAIVEGKITMAALQHGSEPVT